MNLDQIEAKWVANGKPITVLLPATNVLELLEIARAAQALCDEPITSGIGRDTCVRVTSYRAIRERFAPWLTPKEGTPNND